MKTTWDYTNLADSYVKRPNYASSTIAAMLRIVQTNDTSNVCDIGAGVGHLTIELAPHCAQVNAVEPNDAMRKIGQNRTLQIKNIKWFEGTAEDTTQNDKKFNLCTFGSSFNVCNQLEALKEVKRILKPGGWFVCMWNHRDLNDPIQENIESIIKKHVDGFGYGIRRQDQTNIIKECGFFADVVRIEGDVVHTQKIEDVITAWKSHASLQRQAGQQFETIINEIKMSLKHCGSNSILIPYTTRIWVAQLKE